MSRKRKTEPIGIGYTAKQMRKKKPINNEYLVDITPLTDNQKMLFDLYAQQKHIVAYGVAGTGKTFITLYNCLLYTSPSPRDRTRSRMPSSA